MLIRILEDSPYFSKGIHNVSLELARDLISKGAAVKVSEKAINHEAHEALINAKTRDDSQK